MAVAHDGIYKIANHLEWLKQIDDRDPQFTVDVHVRRLEALRRAGLVERVAEGVWTVPSDLMQRAQQLDVQKVTGPVLNLLSHLSLNQQVRAVGATWLDQQLVGNGKGLATQGFGVEARKAMHSRVDFLVEQGFAELRGQRVVLVRDLLATLRDRELASVGQTLQDETGRTYRPLYSAGRASGVYLRSIQLASGCFAVLDDCVGFSLVPWRPVIEQRQGQHFSAVVRGQAVIWDLGRRRSFSV